MKFRTTIVLLVLVLLALGYVFFIDRYKPSTAEVKQTEKRVLQDFRPELITRIVINRQVRENDTGRVLKAVSYELEKETLGWKLVKPVNFPVNTPLVRQILDNLKKMDRHRSIGGADYENMNRDQTGLNNPDIVATFDTPETSVVLRVGSVVPLGWEYYAELKGRRQAYFIPNQMRDILCFETDSTEKDVRRRKVFDIAAMYVNAVQMKRPEGEMDFRKGRDLISWYLKSPIEDRSSDKKIDELVKEMAKLEVSAYVDEPKGGVKFAYDLTLVQRENSQRLQISEPMPVINEWDETNYFCYARRTEYGQYFTLEPKILNFFKGSLDDFRARTLLAPGAGEDLDYLIVEKDGKSLDMFFDKSAGKWDMPALLTTLKDELAIEDYAFLWLDLPIEKFADAAEARAALSQKFLKLKVRFRGSDEFKEYSLSAPEKGLQYLERSSNVFVAVSADKVAELVATNHFRFLTREALNLPGEEVEKLEFKIGGNEISFLSGTNFWLATEGEKTRQILPRMKDEIARRMPVLVERYVKEAKAGEESAYGLDKPYMSLGFKMKNGESHSLLVGGQIEDGRYGMVENQPYVFKMNGDTMKALEQFLELGRLYRQ